MLYDEELSVKREWINKTRQCCKVTAGFNEPVDLTKSSPSVPAQEIMKQTIELYTTTVNDLVKQGYPQSMAESIAKKHILGGK